MTKLALALVALLTLPAVADSKAPDPAATATIKEIEKAYGFVPAFVRSISPALLPSWWASSKALDASTALDGKTKELIGLAVAAAMPCEYCVLFHTEAARLYGATDAEIQAAVGVAASTRANSTLMYGLQVDKVQFRKDVDRTVKTARQAKK